jgi:hypothetical protein
MGLSLDPGFDRIATAGGGRAYNRRMCAACAIAAAAGASGARSWLASRHMTWLTPGRLRAATAALFVLAAIASSVVLSGSTPPHALPQHAAVHAR